MPLSAVQPEHYPELLAHKVARVSELLARWTPGPPAVYRSDPTGFRARAEFRIWHQGDDLDYVMFRPDAPTVAVPIARFPIASDAIQRLMPALRALLQESAILRRKLFQVEFLSSLAGDMLVTLVYHRPLQADWEHAATALGRQLGVSIVGRSRRQKIVLGRDFVEEVLTIHGEPFRYRQYEQSFTQPNARVNQRMIEWACERAAGLDGDLLELYCGNGNFTLPLARHFGQVIATELAKRSVRAARENLEANGIANVQIIRLSAQEASQALRGERSFRRLAELPRPLGEYDLRTVFVDPPRAGLDAETVNMVSAFPAILYISCNPQTLAQNLAALEGSHRAAQFALFDQFPYTDHMECGVLLLRK